MKNIIILIFCCIVFIHLTSCEDMMGDFLDKAPGVDVTEDTIFSTKVQVETFVASTYRLGMHTIFPRLETTYTGSQYGAPSAATCDESESGVTWTPQQQWNSAGITIDNVTTTEDFRFGIRFKAIRMANILLKRIDAVPNLDQDYISQIKGEAKFISALNYFEMLKRYGGVPIIDYAFELTDDFLVKRNSVEEVVDFIVSNCNEAISLLPDAYPTNLRGRVTKGAALMLKAKTLLYAASPIFNTATPYLSMDDPANNNLICYGNYDVNRWKLAADAAKAVLDWAPAGGVTLVNDQGIDNNYRYLFEHCDNSEIILASKSTGAKDKGEYPWTFMNPNGFYPSWGMGYGMTLNFMKKYEKQDGTTQTWDPVGGTDLIAKYNELDRRFNQSVAVAGSYWNVDIQRVNSYVGGNHNNGNITGQWILKFIPQSMSNAASRAMPNDVLFRLGEAYLDYAEALNEVNGPNADIYLAVNTIRERSGQPDLPTGLSKDQFRDRVRNERAIELFDEDHRFWDIRRWLIAEQDGVMKGDFYGIKIYPNPAPPDFRYEVYSFETRSFNKNMYLHPFLRSEVLKGYLIQNPGW